MVCGRLRAIVCFVSIAFLLSKGVLQTINQMIEVRAHGNPSGRVRSVTEIVSINGRLCRINR